MQEETETGWFMLDWRAGDGWSAATNNRLHNSLEWDMPCLNGFEGFCGVIIRPSFIPQLLEKNRCRATILAISDLPNHATIVRPIGDRPTFEMRALDEQTKTLITLNLTEMDVLSIDGFVTCWLCCIWRGEKWDIMGR